MVPSLQIKNPDLIIRAIVKAKKQVEENDHGISVLKKMGLLLLQWLLAW